MNKFKKVSALLMAIVIAVGAFAPSAFAAYAPYSWSSWPLQRESGYDRYYTVPIQQFLNIRNSAGLGVDGIFGWRTTDAVEYFQREQGVGVDGKVGSNTWTKMRNLLIHESNVPDNPVVSLEPDIETRATPPDGYYHIKREGGQPSLGQYFRYHYDSEYSRYVWKVYTKMTNDNSYAWYIIHD